MGPWMVPPSRSVEILGAGVSWTGFMAASLAQVVVGEETLVPIGIAVVFLLAGLGFAWKVSRYVSEVNTKLRQIRNILRRHLRAEDIRELEDWRD